MKICFAISAMNSGGAEKVVSALANKLSNNNEITILLVSSNKCSSFYKLNEKIKLIPLLQRNKHKNAFKRVVLLRKKILELNPDVVVAFLPHICIYSFFALFKTKIPLIVSERNDPNQYSFLMKILLKFVFKKSAFCVFQTNEAKNWYKISDVKSSVIYNPVSLMFTPKKGTYILREKKIISVARFSKQKNFPLLFDSFANFVNDFPDYTLKIYGIDGYEDNIKKIIQNLGLEKKVQLMKNSTYWHLDEFDAACFISSSDYEGMSNSLMEAAVLGIPCIATDCPIGGSKEIARVCNNVKLTEVGNKEKMSSLMKTIINFNSCFQGIPQEFDLNVICDKWLDIFKKVVNKI